MAPAILGWGALGAAVAVLVGPCEVADWLLELILGWNLLDMTVSWSALLCVKDSVVCFHSLLHLFQNCHVRAKILYLILEYIDLMLIRIALVPKQGMNEWHRHEL